MKILKYLLVVEDSKIIKFEILEGLLKLFFYDII